MLIFLCRSGQYASSVVYDGDNLEASKSCPAFKADYFDTDDPAVSDSWPDMLPIVCSHT